ncbi:MAG: NOL1/NOP2/sun family putative RNA methylase [Candidatus Latescibacteria bacterium]|nr:NOL1/NOP2/sun family putative RNA methylase [Candidatus Latescibacterota bacterium]
MRKETPTPAAEVRLEALLSHLEQLLGDAGQRAEFRRAALELPPPTLRLNALRPQPASLLHWLQERGEAVPWCDRAFVLSDSALRLGRTLEHALGAFYLQAKAPLLAVEALDPRPGERVLDLAAAPGGKATQIAARLGNTGLLVANEPVAGRVPPLVGNLERCGVCNAVLSKAPGTLLARYFHNYFDRVLLDAPCSGDGVLCKDTRMLNYWSPEEAGHKAQQQKGLLRAAFHLLRPGGVLVYSTCSLSLEENEEVLAALARRHPGQVEVLPVEGLERTPLPADLAARYPADFALMARVWPHLHRTEGAFVAKIRKLQPTVWESAEGDADQWEEAGSEVEARPVRAALEERWGVEFAVPEGQVLALDGRYLSLEPRAAAGLRAHYPHFVRAGLHLARRQQEHYYLSQGAVSRWGERMQGRRVELDWPQVQTLFRGEAVVLEPPVPERGEVLCSFGAWTVCWGLIEEQGCRLRGMVPKWARNPNLERLL